MYSTPRLSAAAAVAEATVVVVVAAAGEAARAGARRAAACVRGLGVCRVVDCLTGLQVSALADVAAARVEVLLAECDRRGLAAEGLKTAEIVCRNAGRFDIPLDGDPYTTLAKSAAWVKIVRRLVGVDMYCVKSGVVVAQPGAEVQNVHADGKHLFAGEEEDDDDSGAAPASSSSSSRHLPPHCVTVFVPLCDLSRDLGPTEYFLGTHRADAGDLVEEAMRGAAPSLVFDDAKAGDAIIFDYRIRHRGLANTAATARPLAYFTYARAWFRDATNYSDLSLFDPGLEGGGGGEEEEEEEEPETEGVVSIRGIELECD